MYPWKIPSSICQTPTNPLQRAEAAGEQPASWLYDFFLDNDGKNLIYIPAANYNADIPTLEHPFTAPHSETVAPMGSIRDTSANIYVLTKWVRKSQKLSWLRQSTYSLSSRPHCTP